MLFRSNDTATTEIYTTEHTLSLHDALPILVLGSWFVLQWLYVQGAGTAEGAGVAYLAHVVGFVAGAVLVIVLGGLRADRRPPRPPPSYYYPDYR